MNFKNKVVIVTGSSSGIGAVTALYFAKLNAQVVITGRNEAKLMAIAKQIEDGKGIKPLVIIADVTKDSDVRKIVEETVETFRKIDVLVNNAGAGVWAHIQNGIEPLDKMISTNLRSAYLLTSIAVPHFIKSKGNIINISSNGSIRPAIGSLPYCVSKAGLDMFTKCVAKELATHGIRVNSVNPGAVRTNIVAAAGLKDKEDEFFRIREERSPLGKIATCEDVAELIVFLASDTAGSITGGIHVIENGDLLL